MRVFIFKFKMSTINLEMGVNLINKEFRKQHLLNFRMLKLLKTKS